LRFLLLAAWLLALAPQAALAHGGHEQADTPLAAAQSLTSQVSPLCPPGTGHACGCGNLSVCDAPGKPAVSSAPAFHAWPGAPAWITTTPRPAPRAHRPSLSPASPRAPPVSS
jgi:hypothetical protein